MVCCRWYICERIYFCILGGHAAMIQLPSDLHITYQHQYRKCGKSTCSTCRTGQGHGPYWYAYWREGSRLRSGYIGKVHPDDESKAVLTAQLSEDLRVANAALEIPTP